MPISAGSRLGPYEVLAPLGAGGMGEVYRAKDARLGRDVALKVLPTEVAKDADRRSRFEQEARAASALATRTSSPSTTSANPRAPFGSRWSWSKAGRCETFWRRGRWRRGARSRSALRSRKAWPPRTRPES